jgi:hypothetical protein
MSLAKFRKVYGKNGSGRFVVSEGVAPSAYLYPHEGLPTLYTDIEDNRFEIVITKGTILSVVANAAGDSRVVPCNGTNGSVTWGDANTVNQYGAATPGTGSSTDTIVVPAGSTPIGCAQYDFYRMFDKGTSQGAGWITHGYVEWPIVQGLNDTVAPGKVVVSDGLGRPVVGTLGDAGTVGNVIEVEKFATNFDDGLLSYMLLPSDPGSLKTVFELTKPGPYNGKLGIRANLDVANVVGAMRVVLKLG